MRHIDVVVNSAGPWSTVRVEQPFLALASLGCDVRFVATPFDPESQIRDGALVVWQRPLPSSVDTWKAVIARFQSRRCLVLVEWDDHPDLFPPSIARRFVDIDYIHLRCCHGIQTSNAGLAKALRKFNPNVFVVENGIHPVPPLRSRVDCEHERVFIGNFNREQEQRHLTDDLLRWLEDSPRLRLVLVGQSGLEGLLPSHRIEIHPPLPYSDYRKSCLVANWPYCPFN